MQVLVINYRFMNRNLHLYDHINIERPHKLNFKKRILSTFLLFLYSLVIGQGSIYESNFLDFQSLPKVTKHSHDYNEVHHKHNFHVGIFHILKHIIEIIDQSNDHFDEYLVAANSDSKRVKDFYKSIDVHLGSVNIVVPRIVSDSLPAPPFYLNQLLPTLSQPNALLRAPPTIS